MTHSDSSPSSIRDDSICESSLPPNKSSGDIGELKPCPWCGSTASRVRIMSRDAIQCDGENCGVIKRTPDEWNTRAPDPESAAEIERLRREVGEANTTIAQLDQRCALFERSTITAESAVAAAREDEREGCALVAENAYTGRTKTGTHPLQIARAIRARASAIRAAVSKKTAESGHSPSTHNSESE